jgi:predicted GNAT family N-acyltransferase
MLVTVAELVESYRLRYDVYSALGYLQRSNPSGLEIDPYDAYSIPLGAFDPVSGEMIGTLRLITVELQPDYEHLIHGVLGGSADDALARRVLSPRPYRLPSMISSEIARQIAAFKPEGFAVRELSRTIVRPGRRGVGVSRRLMELGLAYATRRAPAVLIGSCLPEHVGMYARYGYRKLPHTGLDHFASVGQIANAVVCRTDMLPEPTRAHVGALIRSMCSGAMAHVLDLASDSRVLFRLAAPRRAGYRTMEW